MSRVAKSPVEVPAGVEVTLSGQDISVKGSKGTLAHTINRAVEIKQDGNVLTFISATNAKQDRAQAGTVRALVNNMVTGVTDGFEKKLVLNGVGDRAQVEGKTVNLTLGFSHPVDYALPEGVKAESPSQTEIVLKSADKQLLGRVAAEIRAYREPEPYKGKGVRYSDEVVRRKEAKKK
jgi:large subunit ribosomal protein L6